MPIGWKTKNCGKLTTRRRCCRLLPAPAAVLRFQSNVVIEDLRIGLEIAI